MIVFYLRFIERRYFSKEFNPPLSWSLIALDACIWGEPNVVGFLISTDSLTVVTLSHDPFSQVLQSPMLHCGRRETDFSPSLCCSVGWLNMRAPFTKPISSRVRNLQWNKNDKSADQFAIVGAGRAIIYQTCWKFRSDIAPSYMLNAFSPWPASKHSFFYHVMQFS